MITNSCIVFDFSRTMVRNYKGKKPSIDEEKLKAAVLEVKNTGTSVKATAAKFGVSRMTLSDWVKRNKSSREESSSEVVLPKRGQKTVRLEMQYSDDKKITSIFHGKQIKINKWVKKLMNKKNLMLI